MILFNNKKLISLALLSFFLAIYASYIFLPLVKPVKAEILGGLEKTGGEIGYDTNKKGEAKTEIAALIGKIIGAVMAFIGVVFMVLIWMGAFDIVGAGGNDETVKKGKDKIKNGAIGILIIFAAYLFAYVILGIVGGKFGVGFNIFNI